MHIEGKNSLGSAALNIKGYPSPCELCVYVVNYVLRTPFKACQLAIF